MFRRDADSGGAEKSTFFEAKFFIWNVQAKSLVPSYRCQPWPAGRYGSANQKKQSGGAMISIRTVGTSLVVAALLLVGACAKPLKVGMVDKNADPIVVGVLDVSFRDAEGGKLSREHLTEALIRSVEESLRDASDQRVTVVRARSASSDSAEIAAAHPAATHLLRITASVASYSKRKDDYWDPCSYQDKQKNCVGALVGGGTESATARVEASVFDLRTRREVFRIDPLESKPLRIGDDTPMEAARPIAKQLVALLKDAGLLRRGT